MEFAEAAMEWTGEAKSYQLAVGRDDFVDLFGS
jgi:hypothetical protein